MTEDLLQFCCVTPASKYIKQCHAGLDKPAPYCDTGASSSFSGFPGQAGEWRLLPFLLPDYYSSKIAVPRLTTTRPSKSPKGVSPPLFGPIYTIYWALSLMKPQYILDIPGTSCYLENQYPKALLDKTGLCSIADRFPDFVSAHRLFSWFSLTASCHLEPSNKSFPYNILKT